MFDSIRKVILRHTGLDSLYEMVLHRLGSLQSVYLTGALATGVDHPIIDLVMIGSIDRAYLNDLIPKAEAFIGKKIRVALYEPHEWDENVLEGERALKLL